MPDSKIIRDNSLLRKFLSHTEQVIIVEISDGSILTGKVKLFNRKIHLQVLLESGETHLLDLEKVLDGKVYEIKNIHTGEKFT